MKKKIAIWIQGGIGGGMFSQGYPAINQLIAGLSEQYDIDIYSQLPANPDYIPQGFRFYSLNSKIKSGTLRWIYLFFVFLIKHIRKPYKVLFSFWGYPAGAISVVLGLVTRRPSVVYLHGGDSVCIPSIPYGVFCDPKRARICRWAYPRSSRLLTISHYQATRLKAQGIAKETDVVPYGIDAAVFAFKEARFETPSVRFIHVGNQTPIKDQRTMLEAFSFVAQSIPASLTIVGPDFFGGQLKEWCISLGIEHLVTFIEPQPNAQLASYYHQADIMLHTSLYEAQGFVFAEAAACGTLIAGTRVGMLADMGEACGIIVEPGQSKLLAEKILSTLKKPDELKAKQLAALQWTQKINADYTVKKITEILNEVM